MTTETATPVVSPVAPGSGALTWSAEKPKRRGWWWVEMPDRKGNVGIAVRKVDESNLGPQLYVHAGTLGWVALVCDTVADWRWAGPLAEPVEPSDAQSLPNKQLCDPDQIRD